MAAVASCVRRQGGVGKVSSLVMGGVVSSGEVGSVVCDGVGRRAPGKRSRRKTKCALDKYPLAGIHAVPGGSMRAVGTTAE
jgi:hypothetical protein